MASLIYTRLQKFWPDDELLILLAPWYLPPYSPDKKLNISVLTSPWNNHEKLEKAFDYANETYEDIVEKLGVILNDIHNTNYSIKYWRIIAGPWLLWFVNVIYDRYVRITDALKQYPNIKINCLDSSCYITPHNSLDFVQRSKHDDVYNMQLITKILRAINHAPSAIINCKQTDDLSSLYVSNKKNKLTFKSAVRHVISVIEPMYVKLLIAYSDVVFFRSYFNNSLLNKLFFFSSGKFLKIDSLKSQIIIADINVTQRENLKQKCEKEKSGDVLYDLVMHLLPTELPKTYLEGYELIIKEVERVYGKGRPKAVVSATGWYFEENFKFWVAGLQHQGVRLIGIQHGGNYGLTHMCGDDHEYAIADNFITWGWSKPEKGCAIAQGFCQKMMITNKEKNKNNEKILFAATSPCRNLIQFPWVPELSILYLESQNDFFSSIEAKIQKKISVRTHYQDDTWEIQKNLNLNFSRLSFENWDLPFQKSLQSSRIFITDYISTTFIEALAANIPTVLFFNPSINILEKESKEFFDELFAVKIIHYTPKSAANWVNKVYDSVDAWWNSKETQYIVQKFIGRYARESSSPLSDWLNILKGLRSLGCAKKI